MKIAPATGFRLPSVLLPRAGVDLFKWAVIACDQYTAEPEYWQRVAAAVGDAPSTLQLIFPEVYLGAPDAKARIGAIQQAMRGVLDAGLLQEREPGAVYVERTIGAHKRRGLMLELDLEHYDFSPQSTSLIRPTEGTIIARLAPRIEVRRDAELELPHVLVLIDDPDDTVIGPIAAAGRGGQLERLYETDLMEGGGHVAGYAVDAALAEQAQLALQALAAPEVFAQRYGVPSSTPPMLFAMGDGNHSLATAKAIWEQAKARVGMDHPSRWALVEVENIHDPALHFAPIHRLLLGVRGDAQGDLRAALVNAFGPRLRCTDVDSAATMRERVHAISAARGTRQAAGLVGPGARFAVVELDGAGAPAGSGLMVGQLQSFIDRFIEQGGAREVDYVHGDDVLERLAQETGAAGFHLATVSKGELLARVVHDGPLPRKTFSMGEANEKRYYVEARRIR